MPANEKGSTLVIVLLVLLIFSVLGISLIGNVVGQSKRVQQTETHVQERNLVRDGLTYFEADFKQTVDKFTKKLDAPTIEDLKIYFHKYEKWVAVTDEVEIMVIPPDILKDGNSPQKYTQGSLERKKFQVKSREKKGAKKDVLVGNYELDFDINFDEPTYHLADFQKEGVAIDLTKKDIIGLDIWLLDLGLINLRGNNDRFHQLPSDEIIGIDLLHSVLGLSIGDGDRFKTMEKRQVVLTRKGELLNLGLIGKLLNVNLLNFRDEPDSNVNINGYFGILELLGLDLIKDFRDINFKKLAVVGNALIQQDKRDYTCKTLLGIACWSERKPNLRSFNFQEGLYVNKSLIIGATKNHISKLKLGGDMVAMDTLNITDVDLQINHSNVYVHGDSPSTTQPEETTNPPVALIKNACITSNDKDFHLFSKGKISLENNSRCNTFDGLFYSEDIIEINTKGQDITINGELIGEVKVIGGGKLTINRDPNYYDDVIFENITLAPLGRSFE
ncbi:hypothetical protein [Bacillus tuaregi]|uniref:hypothetical protein n=1 Tax=Bacillus tuaregi TaxID=1816695 RepID=UPI0008F8BA99|nr:hypothetical protein [Bacillus tuaregi]